MEEKKEEEEAAVIDLARSAPAFMPHAAASRAGLLHCARGQDAMNSPPNNRKWSRDEAGRTRLQSARASRQTIDPFPGDHLR